ncbi:MAG TPA: dihydrolipoamide acetyltransferase family protein [Candidatus Acidoferrales bacterium]|nr:dihydrolipoamide acetyltransferase family protein [Candidatus Acidoferrales bacterium]
MSEFRMPSLGADMESGILVDWRIKPGDTVKRGDIVAEVETEKGVIEVEIFESGIIDSLVVQPGQKVPVGATLAILRTDGKRTEAETAAKPAPAAPEMKVSADEEPPSKITEAPLATEPPRPRISPLARKRAEALGVDLAGVVGTGEAGSVTAADVERAAEQIKRSAEPAPKVSQKAIDYTAMRRVIAAAMARSKREIPHYYLASTLDMRRALDWLSVENAKRPVTRRLLYSALLLRAVALAAREIPEVNGFWINEAFKPADGIHVGVAISLRQGGLINPAIHDVDKKNLDALMEDMLDLVNRARTGHLRSSELADGTITVTNLGEQGVESVFGVIYPPQVALIGFGKIIERPVAQGGMLGVRPTIKTTLAADHRVSDGHRGGRFLLAIDRLLQEPEKL